MPNEPERDIEKLLKALAQKRRDEAGAPLELHLATRRMLHAEVARRSVKARRTDNVFATMLNAFRSWPAFGAAILAVLLVATWALLPSLDRTTGKVELAQRVASSPATLARKADLEVASAPTDGRAPKPEVKATTVAFESVRQEASGAATTAQDRMAEPAIKTLSRAKMADSQFGEKGITPGIPEIARTAREEEIKMIVAGGPIPSVRGNDPAMFRTGSYGQAGSPATQSSESATAPSAGTAGLAQQAALREARARRLLESDNTRKTEVALAPQLGSAPSPTPPASGMPQTDLKKQVAYSDLSQTKQAPVTQKFVQTDLQPRVAQPGTEAKGAAIEAILTSFQIAQAGDRIQVIDNDGSTYAGFLRPAPAPAAPQKARGVFVAGAQSANEKGNRLAMAADQPAAPQNRAFSFQVEGTNRTFRQRVVFTGNLLVDTDALSAKQSNAESNQRSALQLQQNGPTSTELQNSRIAGQAVIGDGRTLQINAAPASP